ncbi:FG-GAP and VCBS repeat-containing protein [Streptomyces sp. NPDC050703]|uniref:FG-GAP and VCBS repeat-containing protein n=1 Tax=Streptomyces sp. NPDC050703 TaxID=3157218 RepID=UPI00343C17DA
MPVDRVPVHRDRPPVRALRPRRRRAARWAGAVCVAVALAAGAVVLGRDTGRPPEGPAKAHGKRVVTDFDGDGHADLVVPARLSTAGGVRLAGSVSVVHGSAAGPDLRRPQVVDRAAEGPLGDLAAREEQFGTDAVARDLDGDGFTDLALGRTVLWGSPRGLRTGGTLAVGGVRGGDFDGDGHADLLAADLAVSYGPFDRSGKPSRKGSAPERAWGDSDVPRTVTVGDLTGDGRDDVVTGQGFEEMQYRGYFFAGGAAGLAREPKELNTYNGTGTVGDVDGDGYGDLVVRELGAVSESAEHDEGEIRVLRGSPSGPGREAAVIDQETAGVPGTGAEGDQFGSALAAGDVDDDGWADVAVGVPGEDGGRGGVVLLFGSPTGLTGAGARSFGQDTPGMPGTGEPGDGFGSALLLTDMTGDRRPELAVGAPGEDGAAPDAGAAWVLNGTSSGPGPRIGPRRVASFGPAALGAPEHGSDGTVIKWTGTHFGRTLVG